MTWLTSAVFETELMGIKGVASKVRPIRPVHPMGWR